MASFREECPAEVIGLFVHELANDKDKARRKNSLSACAHVSKLFYYASLRYRFAEIDITIPIFGKDAKSMASFLHLFRANSGLLKYIQRLTLIFDGRRQRHFATPESFPPPNSAILPVSQIVEMLSPANIRALSIKAACHRGTLIDLRPLEWQGLLVALRCIPSIKIFHLEGVQNVPRALIVGNPAKDTLEELHLSNVMLPTCATFKFPRRTSRTHPNFVRRRHVLEAACTVSNPPLSQLQVLKLDTVRYFHSFLRFFERNNPLPPPMFPHLRCFTLFNYRSDYDDYKQRDEIIILGAALPSLESLTLENRFLSQPPGLLLDQLDFTQLKNLRHLHITGWEYSWEQNSVCLLAFCRIFACATTPTKIKSLSLTLMRRARSLDSLDRHLAVSEWSHLDRILNNGNFSALQELTLNIQYSISLYARIGLEQKLKEARGRIFSLLPLVSANEHTSFRQNLGAVKADYGKDFLCNAFEKA